MLCVPKIPEDKILDLPEETFHQLMAFSRKVALGLREAVPCKRIAISVIGLEVPHAHVHLIPIEKIEDVTFQSKISLNSNEMEILAIKISKAIDHGS